ncbi:metalloregulator ArsR/SmtB family transcription factor [Isoptericola halotolerans]|uniref:ArsR family transcriptional regulator n=1 Tax=Isoptericola halotolerans TaxID=300560 RepID=A0ABX1ZYY0_9MICO|nr:metalloregulator ArsR/SmtB family transcription factor [Isoptericola halotolerans]NOV95676.1 ArsR family transcriptional regulator [Isoptericola halotolerans]
MSPAQPAPSPRPSVESPSLRATLSRAQAESTASLLRVVSDPTRLQILSLIRSSPEGASRVADLTRELGLRQPTVSHHLKVMAEAGVLTRRPAGREVWYGIEPARLDAIGDLLR